MDIVVAAVLMLAGTGGLLVLALGGRSDRRALGRRVEAVTSASWPKSGESRLDSLRRLRIVVGLRSLFAFRMRRSWGARVNPVYLLAAGVVGAAVTWLLGRFAGYLPNYLLAVAAAGGFFLVPRIVLVWQQRRSDAQFAELLPDAIDMVVRIVRAGLPVGVAIRTVGQEASAPLSAMFGKVADQSEIGVPLDEAVARTSEVVGNPDFRFFAVAVALQQSTGGNLAATLEALSQIIRRRRAVRLKARAATAEVRMSGIVLGSIPFFVTGALLMVAPNYLRPLFADPRGRIILGVALLGVVLAGTTMRMMVRNSLRL